MRFSQSELKKSPYPTIIVNPTLEPLGTSSCRTLSLSVILSRRFCNSTNIYILSILMLISSRSHKYVWIQIDRQIEVDENLSWFFLAASYPGKLASSLIKPEVLKLATEQSSDDLVQNVGFREIRSCDLLIGKLLSCCLMPLDQTPRGYENLSS